MVASYDGNILQFKISEDVPLNKYRGESTETLSQAAGSTTTTFYEQETPLKEKDVDTDELTTYLINGGQNRYIKKRTYGIRLPRSLLN